MQKTKTKTGRGLRLAGRPASQGMGRKTIDGGFLPILAASLVSSLAPLIFKKIAGNGTNAKKRKPVKRKTKK
jgi:hypothetical protein